MPYYDSEDQGHEHDDDDDFVCKICGNSMDTLDQCPTCDEDPPVAMTPTPEQASALSAMLTFLDSGGDFFCLKGYAGTGKSYSITLLAKEKLDDGSPRFKPSQICFTAPTNKAVKVLRNYLDSAGLLSSPSKTIYSLLGLSLQANGEVKELTKPDEPVDLSGYSVIVVDEASMVNRFLMDAIRDAYDQWKVPFIFMGDPAQLPPVGEITAPVWKLPNGAELTTVMRYGNSMLDLATSIRKIVDAPFPSIRIESNPPVFRHAKADWFNAIEANLDLFHSGDAKVIAWRNITVDSHNNYIRGLLYGRKVAKDNQWIEGDQIVARAPLKDLSGDTFMQNAEEATIEAVAVGHHPLFKEFEIFNLLVLHETGRKHTIRTLTPTGQFHVNNRLNELSIEAKNGKKWKWKDFWALKEAFHDVRHAYAWTSHMSQGSSVQKVFVDLEDIMLNRNRGEAFRSLYVACTRQREELHVA